MIKICPKCKAELNCLSIAITQCKCQSISISKKKLNELNQKWTDCLCPSCLIEYAKDLEKR